MKKSEGKNRYRDKYITSPAEGLKVDLASVDDLLDMIHLRLVITRFPDWQRRLNIDPLARNNFQVGCFRKRNTKN